MDNTTQTHDTYRVIAPDLDLHNLPHWIRVNIRWRWQGKSFTLAFSPAGQPGRKVQNGPMHEELFGWLNEEPVMVAAVHVPDRRIVYIIEEGDEIVVEGHGTFVVVPGNWDTNGRPQVEVKVTA